MSKQQPRVVEKDEERLRRKQASADRIFYYGIFVFTLICAPFYYGAIKINIFVNERAPEGYRFPKIIDLSWCIVAAIGFSVMQLVLDKISRPFFWHICKEKEDEAVRAVRAEKASYCFFKFVYYTGMTIAEYMIMQQEPWFPWYLGGKGNDMKNELEYAHLGTNPYNPVTPGLLQFYQAQIGYRAADLFIHSFVKKKRANDFNEMLLHHIVALALVINSFLTNIMPIGAMIMLLHDLSDIFTSLMRLIGETTFYTGFPAKVFYLGMIVSWIYCRLIILPYFAHVMGWQIEIGGKEHGYDWWGRFFGLYLMLLWVMHWYWFKMLVGIAIRYLTTGKGDDPQNVTLSNSANTLSKKDKDL